MVKMIVMDLDGTLLSSDKNISDYSVSILEKCKINGIKIVIATGRSEKSSERCIKLINPDFMILNGGALVLRKDRKIIYEKVISVETSDGILNELKKYKNNGFITIDTINNYFVNYENPPWHSDYLHGIYYDFLKPLSQKTYKITVEIKNKEIIKELESKYSNVNIVKFTDEDGYGIYPYEANKLIAINAIIGEENITLKNIVSFGDDFNDIEMIKNCGIGIAMENGIDEIKKIAKYICGNNNEDGVAKWIENNILKDRIKC
jgi:Cof subfamily protein (haloacid dehalogenase superfamily)